MSFEIYKGYQVSSYFISPVFKYLSDRIYLWIEEQITFHCQNRCYYFKSIATSAKSNNIKSRKGRPRAIIDHSPSEPILGISITLCLCSTTQRTFRYFSPLGYDQFIGIAIEPMTDTSELDVSCRHLLNLHQAICAFGDRIEAPFILKRGSSGYLVNSSAQPKQKEREESNQ